MSIIGGDRIDLINFCCWVLLVNGNYYLLIWIRDENNETSFIWEILQWTANTIVTLEEIDELLWAIHIFNCYSGVFRRQKFSYIYFDHGSSHEILLNGKLGFSNRFPETWHQTETLEHEQEKHQIMHYLNFTKYCAEVQRKHFLELSRIIRNYVKLLQCNLICNWNPLIIDGMCNMIAWMLDDKWNWISNKTMDKSPTHYTFTSRICEK